MVCVRVAKLISLPPSRVSSSLSSLPALHSLSLPPPPCLPRLFLPPFLPPCPVALYLPSPCMASPSLLPGIPPYPQRFLEDFTKSPEGKSIKVVVLRYFNPVGAHARSGRQSAGDDVALGW